MATIRTVGGWCVYSRSDGKSPGMIIYSFLNRKCTHVREKKRKKLQLHTITTHTRTIDSLYTAVYKFKD